MPLELRRRKRRRRKRRCEFDLMGLVVRKEGGRRVEERRDGTINLGWTPIANLDELFTTNLSSFVVKLVTFTKDRVRCVESG